MNTNNSNLDYIEIPLTKGQVAWISPEDSELTIHKWCASFSKDYAGGGKYVPMRGIKIGYNKRTNINLSRVVMARIVDRELLRSEYVDHINGNTLDNRRENLRIATHAENQHNTGKSSNNKSGYKGVSWNASNRKWLAQIRHKGKHYWIGYYRTPEEAYEAYCDKARELRGEFLNLG